MTANHRFRLAVFCLTLLPGCSAFLPLSAPGADSAVEPDTPPDPLAPAASRHDLSLTDATLTDATPTDTALTDAALFDVPPFDAPLPDGAQPDTIAGADTGTGCVPPAVDSDTVALFTFETPAGSGSVTDLASGHTMNLVKTSPVAGPAGCGKALGFGGTTSSYGWIDHHADFDLAQGSIDFWVRFDAAAPGDKEAGLLARDQMGDTPDGQLALFRDKYGYLAVRLQNGGMDHVMCAKDPLPDETWIHVGLSFGPALRLFVDGVEAYRTGNVSSWSVMGCAQPTAVPGGTTGNTYPWVVGVGTHHATTAYPVLSEPLAGAIDNLRFSSTPHTFGAPSRP